MLPDELLLGARYVLPLDRDELLLDRVAVLLLVERVVLLVDRVAVLLLVERVAPDVERVLVVLAVERVVPVERDAVPDERAGEAVAVERVLVAVERVPVVVVRVLVAVERVAVPAGRVEVLARLMPSERADAVCVLPYVRLPAAARDALCDERAERTLPVARI